MHDFAQPQAAMTPAPAPTHPAPQEDGGPVELLVQLDVRAERITSMIARGMTVTGKIEGPEGVIVRGEFIGDIVITPAEGDNTGTVLVDEGAVVRGLVSGRRVVVLGTVDGDVISTTSLVLGEKGRITQHTYYHRFLTADGAELEGYVRRIKPGMDPMADLRARRAA